MSEAVDVRPNLSALFISCPLCSKTKAHSFEINHFLRGMYKVFERFLHPCERRKLYSCSSRAFYVLYWAL